jgi:hypothetical protein
MGDIKIMTVSQEKMVNTIYNRYNAWVIHFWDNHLDEREQSTIRECYYRISTNSGNMEYHSIDSHILNSIKKKWIKYKKQ